MSVTSNEPNGAYPVGTPLRITVNYDEDITYHIAQPTPFLFMNTGPSLFGAYMESWTSRSMTFVYTVAQNDASPDLEAIRLELAPGAFTNSSGATVSTVLPAAGSAGSLGATKDIVIDGIRPSVTSIAPSGTYTATSRRWCSGPSSTNRSTAWMCRTSGSTPLAAYRPRSSR